MYSLTKDQLRQLTDPKVKEWFPEVFEVNLEVGKWYKSANSCCEKLIVNVVSIEGNEFTGYGIDNLGKWLNEDGWELKNPIEATEKEVFEALKIEAVRRGFVEGVYFKSPVSGDNYKFTNIYFIGVTDMVWSENGGVIFEKGNWATIVKTITKSEAEKLLNKKIID